LQQATYNDHYHQNAWTFFTLVAPDGHICYVSEFDGAKAKDRALWDDSKVYEELEKKYPIADRQGQWSKFKFVIGGDKAYEWISMPSGWDVIVTQTARRPENGDMEILEESDLERKLSRAPDPRSNNSIPKDGSEVTVTYTPRLTPHRAVVERAFNAMYEWHILQAQDYLFENMANLRPLLTIIAALTNVYRKGI
jgi:hypothetical protein